MKKYLTLFIIIFLVSCQTPKFYIDSKRPSNCVECETCIVTLYPVNKPGKELCEKNNIERYEALVNCNQYRVGGILKMNRKRFTNF